MRFDGLAVLVLQQIRERTLERAGRPAGERRCVPAGFDAVACRLVADQPHAGIVDEGVEDADRIGSRRRRRRSPRRAAGPPAAWICTRVSMPMTRWKSRTIVGNGCGPAAVPKQ